MCKKNKNQIVDWTKIAKYQNLHGPNCTETECDKTTCTIYTLKWEGQREE